MRGLGISIYPGKINIDENKQYIQLASELGFSRIFTCLLSLKDGKEKIFNDFKETVLYGASLGMKVVADVSPKVFQELDLSPRDLSFFKELGLYGIRLDLGFGGPEESMMSYNAFDLKIELNISGGTKGLENILSYCPNRMNLLGCHNFYPHRYTGLSRKHFMETSQEFKKQGIRTAAFVSSNHATHGPWPVMEGLCTLEEHRGLPIEVQAKDLFNTNLIDDVIIANALAHETELRSLSKLNRQLLTLRVALYEDLPELERKIIFEEPHFNRGDISDYMLRSTQSRVKYQGHHFAVFNPKPIKRGDILIDSSQYGHYAGELQVALKDMENSGKTNVVGRVVEEEHFLLDTIQPWQHFSFSL